VHVARTGDIHTGSQFVLFGSIIGRSLNGSCLGPRPPLFPRKETPHAPRLVEPQLPPDLERPHPSAVGDRRVRQHRRRRCTSGNAITLIGGVPTSTPACVHDNITDLTWEVKIRRTSMTPTPFPTPSAMRPRSNGAGPCGNDAAGAYPAGTNRSRSSISALKRRPSTRISFPTCPTMATGAATFMRPIQARHGLSFFCSGFIRVNDQTYGGHVRLVRGYAPVAPTVSIGGTALVDSCACGAGSTASNEASRFQISPSPRAILATVKHLITSSRGDIALRQLSWHALRIY